MEENKNTQKEEINESNASRRIRLLGIDGEDKIHDSDAEIKEGNFFSNLWYRHKWAIIIGTILVVIAIIFIVQLATTPKYDMNLSYVGPQRIDINTKNAIDYSFLAIMDDYNKNGEKNLNFASIMYQNEEQQKLGQDSVTEGKENIVFGGVLTAQANREALETFFSQMMAGTVAIYMLDMELYLDNKVNFAPLEEITGQEIDKDIMCKENAVYLKQTDFYRYMIKTEEGKALSTLPNDTVVCVINKIVTVDDELYSNSAELFKAMINFAEN